MPAPLEVIPLRHGHIQQRFDRLHILRLHLTQIIQKGEFRQRRHKRIALELQIKVTYDANGVTEAFEAQLDNLEVIGVLEWTGETGEEGHPGVFEHGADVSELRCAEELLIAGASPLGTHERSEESLSWSAAVS